MQIAFDRNNSSYILHISAAYNDWIDLRAGRVKILTLIFMLRKGVDIDIAIYIEE